ADVLHHRPAALVLGVKGRAQHYHFGPRIVKYLDGFRRKVRRENIVARRVKRAAQGLTKLRVVEAEQHAASLPFLNLLSLRLSLLYPCRQHFDNAAQLARLAR